MTPYPARSTRHVQVIGFQGGFAVEERRRLPRIPTRQKAGNIVGMHRTSEQKSLPHIAPQAPQDLELLHGLDAFRRDADAEVAAEIDQAADDRLIV